MQPSFPLKTFLPFPFFFFVNSIPCFVSASVFYVYPLIVDNKKKRLLMINRRVCKSWLSLSYAALLACFPIRSRSTSPSAVGAAMLSVQVNEGAIVEVSGVVAGCSLSKQRSRRQPTRTPTHLVVAHLNAAFLEVLSAPATAQSSTVHHLLPSPALDP